MSIEDDMDGAGLLKRSKMKVFFRRVLVALLQVGLVAAIAFLANYLIGGIGATILLLSLFAILGLINLMDAIEQRKQPASL